eukprot:TRINITY_DN2992_c0_g1_i2.p1 TRINITY_DN2992_c0_g1~~TRINITY_DN2992_c0_g1_i2.p1  ORF type:complete len:946 (+),score=205.61 TRINITY_DN2992_c0_g1_i2:67-2904(+)
MQRLRTAYRENFGGGPRTTYPPIAFNNSEENRGQDFPNNTIHSTKYNVVTFFPRFLYEQFRKLTSTYFLLTLIISFIPAISPLSPWPTFMGFAFIQLVAAAREIYDDFKRYKADRKSNRMKYEVVEVTSGELKEVRCSKIRVGDLVYVTQDKQIPADMVLLISSIEGANCYLETAQLDGETNLKMKKAPRETETLSQKEVANLKGVMQCEAPNANLYNFQGTVTFDSLPSVDDNRSTSNNDSNKIPLGPDNILLKNTTLRNTEWVIGVVAYAGQETKLALNQKPPPSKMSTLDKRLNFYVISILLAQLALCLIEFGMAIYFEKKLVDHSWYLSPVDPLWNGVLAFFQYFVILSYIIPLSLVVSLEVIKMIQAQFMEWDDRMRNPETGKGAVAKTSNLNDELGLVEYVFSDKTGTLTENKMIFDKCSVNGRIYNKQAITELLEANNSDGESLGDFFTVLSLCHNVITERDEESNSIKYRASSPDEEALVYAAAENGFEFLGGGSEGRVKVQMRGQTQEYVLLDVLEFSSDRRRMSVVIQDSQGKIWLYTKGSDAMMLPRLAEDGDKELKKKTEEHLSEFSNEGLRTLIIARREVSKSDYESFHKNYTDAASTLEGRDEAVDAVTDPFETQLTLLGATAIEDKLQEHVPETIEYLMEMGIKVWVITGDKQETAISIGHSTKLLRSDMHLAIINAESSEECLNILKEAYDRHNESNKETTAMIIDGHSLKFALADHPDEFLQFALIARSVICCRVTPLQKANVVRLVKEKTGAICLAIGDGANDVGMIQEANVGVGIFGREGTQAARTSDYAIQMFQHLQRLLAIHGRYSLVRSAGVIHYSFYKNFAVFFVQMWWSFFCGYSAQSLYDDWMMTVFNILITSIPPIIYGVFEKDISEKLINTNPRIYNRTQSKRVFTSKTLAVWILAAIYHSLIFFFGTMVVFGEDIYS